MKNLIKEPLVHLLALGAILFGIGLARGDAAGLSTNRIALTPGVVERLIEGFRLTWQRPAGRKITGAELVRMAERAGVLAAKPHDSSGVV